MIAVKILHIGPVMHPVVGGSIEHPFQRSHPPDHLGVDPELVKQADRLHGHHHQGIKAQQGQPDPEEKSSAQKAGPGLAQGGGEIVALGGVVIDMGGPEKPAFVAEAVEDIVGEIFQKEQQNPAPPHNLDIEQAVFVSQEIEAQHRDLGQQLDQHIADPHRQAGGSIFNLIQFAVLDGADNRLHDHQNDKRRYR